MSDCNSTTTSYPTQQGGPHVTNTQQIKRSGQHEPTANTHQSKQSDQDGPTANTHQSKQSDQDGLTANTHQSKQSDQDGPTANTHQSKQSDQDGLTANTHQSKQSDQDGPTANTHQSKQSDQDGPTANTHQSKRIGQHGLTAANKHQSRPGDHQVWTSDTCQSQRGGQHFFVCQCFFTHNIFLQQFNLHVTFYNKDQFFKDWTQILYSKGCCSNEQREEVLKQIETELERRRHLGSDCLQRSQLISQGYAPLHKHVYKLQESYLSAKFLDLVKYAQERNATTEELVSRISEENASRVYSFHVFTEQFCDEFMEEISHFENTDLPKGRPNTMNNYGILLNELGFDKDFITPLRVNYLLPLTSLLYPDCGGDFLDSHKAFVVKYKLGEDLDLSYHYDNAEITINVSLGREFAGGMLYFGDMRQVPLRETECTEYEHKPTIGLLHRGQHQHGALPITSGERYNLIVWMRSSRIRNQLCPMCNNKPTLVKVVGYGDGFTQETVDVCTTL